MKTLDGNKTYFRGNRQFLNIQQLTPPKMTPGSHRIKHQVSWKHETTGHTVHLDYDVELTEERIFSLDSETAQDVAVWCDTNGSSRVLQVHADRRIELFV